MSSGLRAFARLITAAAIVTAYVALHLAITAGMDLRACERFREAPARAAAFTTALGRYAGGSTSARTDIRVGEAWFEGHAPPGRSRSVALSAARDARGGRVSAARERAAGLVADAEQDQAGLARRLRSSSATALYWALPAVLLLAAALWLRRRRRSGAAEIVALVSRFAPPRPWWRRPVFLAAVGVGNGLFAAGALAAGGAQREGYELPPVTFVSLLVGGLAALGAGVLVLRWARPRSARGAAQALLADGRSPVLYLRSFVDDDTAAQVDDTSAYVSIHSREEQLAGALGTVGPVIAVGRPGEPLPRLGAARFYLPLDDWRPTVLRLMSLSRLIVLRLGPGEGLWWEVQQARATQPARKLVLLAPFGPTEVVERLDEYLMAPARLDAVAGTDPWTSAVITFGPDWTPHVHPVGPRPRPGTSRGSFVRRPARAVRAVLASATTYTPAHQLARAIKAALDSAGLRRRTMTWRSGLAAQNSLLSGLTLVTAVALLVWLLFRASQLFGAR